MYKKVHSHTVHAHAPSTMSCEIRHAIRAQIFHALRTATWHCSLNVDIHVYGYSLTLRWKKGSVAPRQGAMASLPLFHQNRFWPPLPGFHQCHGRERPVASRPGNPRFAPPQVSWRQGRSGGPPGLHTEITTIRACAAGHRDISLSVSPTRIEHQPTNHP